MYAHVISVCYTNISFCHCYHRKLLYNKVPVQFCTATTTSVQTTSQVTQLVTEHWQTSWLSAKARVIIVQYRDGRGEQ